MSESSLTKLREAIDAHIEDRAVLPTIDPYLEVSRAALDAALAAVEQEMAALRKRPTLEEVEACVTGGWMSCDDEEQATMTRLRCHLKRRAEAAT